jgi:hypothetical protein
MQVFSSRPFFATRCRWQSLALLLLTIAGVICCLSVALWGDSAPRTAGQGGRDLLLYRHIVERVHAGENYYDAAASELRDQGYPTGSLFNWRPPLYAWLIGSLPSPAWGQILVILLAVVTLLLAFTLLQSQAGRGHAVVGVLLLLGVFLWCVDGDAFLAQELWSGMLLTLSVCAYGQQRQRLGFAAGLAAVFFRELALPYAGIALLLAWRQGRRKEMAAWVVGLLLYGLFMVFHGMEVARRITPADHLPASWIQFGGTAFLLATCRMNSFLFAAPPWVSAIYLPLSLLGLLCWRGETAARLGLTILAYLAAFAVVGQPFNNYWGLMYAGLLPFGLVWAPAVLSDLLRTTFGQVREPQLV